MSLPDLGSLRAGTVLFPQIRVLKALVHLYSLWSGLATVATNSAFALPLTGQKDHTKTCGPWVRLPLWALSSINFTGMKTTSLE